MKTALISACFCKITVVTQIDYAIIYIAQNCANTHIMDSAARALETQGAFR